MTSRRMLARGGLPCAQAPPEHAERPEQQRHHGDDGRGEEHEERRQQGEAGAGPDVRVGWLRRGEEQHDRECWERRREPDGPAVITWPA